MKKKLSKTILQSMEQINTAQNEVYPERSRGTKKSPILAFDYGEKFCGLAWSPDGVVVFPLEIVETAKAREKILELYKAKKCQQLVIGLPISGDGTENNVCQKIRNFATALRGTAGFLDIENIEFVNERNSSQETFFRGKSNQPKQRIDDLAAARILEYWLES